MPTEAERQTMIADRQAAVDAVNARDAAKREREAAERAGKGDNNVETKKLNEQEAAEKAALAVKHRDDAQAAYSKKK